MARYIAYYELNKKYYLIYYLTFISNICSITHKIRRIFAALNYKTN